MLFLLLVNLASVLCTRVPILLGLLPSSEEP